MNDYHIYQIDENEFDRAVSFGWSACQNKAANSYLLYASRPEMEKAFRKEFNSEDGQLTGCYCGNQLLGVMAFFTIPVDYYLQTIGLYAAIGHPQVYDCFIDYLEQGFPQYTAYIGLPAENQMLSQVLTLRGFDLSDDSYDMRLALPKPVRAENNELVSRVEASRWDEYAAYHDRVFPDIYYSSANLKKEQDRFLVFASETDGRIDGAMFVKTADDLAEIFGLQADRAEIQPAFLAAAVYNLQRFYPQCRQLVYFVAAAAETDLACAAAAGFVIASHYRLYSREII